MVLFASLFILSFGASAAPELDAKLLAAAQKPNPAEVRALLAAGADANARAGDGSTPMLYAAHFGDSATVQALLAAKADPNLTNRYGFAPMHEAALRADAALLRTLLDAGAQVDLALPQGETPLMLASRTSGVDAVRLLIEQGRQRQRRRAVARPDASDVRGRGRSRRSRRRVDQGGRRRERQNSDQRSAGAQARSALLRRDSVGRFHADHVRRAQRCGRCDQSAGRRQGRSQRQDAGRLLAARHRARQPALRRGQGAGGGGRERGRRRARRVGRGAQSRELRRRVPSSDGRRELARGARADAEERRRSQ